MKLWFEDKGDEEFMDCWYCFLAITVGLSVDRHMSYFANGLRHFHSGEPLIVTRYKVFGAGTMTTISRSKSPKATGGQIQIR